MKICSKCGELKNLIEFRLEKFYKDGRRTFCKACMKKYEQQRYIKNKEKKLEFGRQWRIKNPEYRAKNIKKCLEYSRKYYAKHPKQRHEYYQQWKIKYPEKYKKNYDTANAKKMSTPKGKLNNSIRCNIRQSLKGSKNGRHWEDLVGYTVDQLKRYLEKRFKTGMTWENYGTYWHVDHKIPIAVFNFEKPEDLDFKRCWTLKNLQPMEAGKNISKGAKLDKFFQPSLRIATKKKNLYHPTGETPALGDAGI